MTASVKTTIPLCVTVEDIYVAQKNIKSHVVCTPLLHCSTFSNLSGKNIFLKAENLQTSGSFKYRGAFNAIAHLLQSSEGKVKCVVTHSSGNHGQAIAKAAQAFNIPAFIVMPTTSPICKKSAVKSYGGVVVECEPTDQGRVNKAQEVCLEKNGYLIHASQCNQVIAGQGTIAIEMLQQNPGLDAIVAPVGGGGMISGIAIAAKHIKPSIKVYAAEPETANDCYLSKKNGFRTTLKHTPKTVADGVKTNIGEKTWPIIEQLVDDVILVTEDEILSALKLIWERSKLLAEPTSGVGVAAVVSDKFNQAKGTERLQNVGVVVCGGNIDLNTIPTLLFHNKFQKSNAKE